MEKQGNILLIEDDADIREGIRLILKSEGYHIIECPDGEIGIEKLTEDLDLIILDIMLPGLSGFQVCEKIRKVSNIPVLFLTARTQESDKMIGFMVGGDDYLTKPFSYVELRGRVAALIRRYQVYSGKQNKGNTAQHKKRIEIENISVDLENNEVTVNERKIELTDIEYNILKLLMQYSGKVFSTKNIYESIWEEPYFYSSNSTVMVHIGNLRKKIEKDPGNPEYIQTVWGKGYRFKKI